MIDRLIQLSLLRRQRFCDIEQRKLREALARFVDDVTRLAVGAASGVQ
jgi:hypothetical protein